MGHGEAIYHKKGTSGRAHLYICALDGGGSGIEHGVGEVGEIAGAAGAGEVLPATQGGRGGMLCEEEDGGEDDQGAHREGAWDGNE